MEPKEPAHNYTILESRTKFPPLQLDPSTLGLNVYEEDHPLESAISSPSSVSVQSPATPYTNRPSSCSSEAGDISEEKEPASGPQRVRSVSIAKGEKEKRKRSRVTPDQLIHLERFFSMDRSPTAARRKEISELLGMQERQTQIWFQNRRAKAKLQDGKQKGPTTSTDTPPDTPPELSTGFEVDLHNLIHEDEPVTIIPCTDLSIGTWRRIATTGGQNDLIAYVCETKRCLTWFIQSTGYGFKMEIPFSTIIDTEFTNAAPGSGLASFILSQPPMFYLEHVSSPRPDGSVIRHWKRCADWTEGQQATTVLRHNLIGSAVQLAHLLRNLHSSTTGSDIPLHAPTYRSASNTPAMELPQPPMAGLGVPEYRFQDDRVGPTTSHQHGHDRGRPYSGSVTLSYPEYSSGDNRSCCTPYPSSGPLPPPLPNFGIAVYPDYDRSATHHGSSPLAAPGDYSSIRGSNILPTPGHLVQPTPRIVYAAAVESPYPDGAESRSFTRPSDYGDGTSSPTILTTPYHPSSSLTHTTVNPESVSSTPIISGLPAIAYDIEGGITQLNQDVT